MQAHAGGNQEWAWVNNAGGKREIERRRNWLINQSLSEVCYKRDGGGRRRHKQRRGQRDKGLKNSHRQKRKFYYENRRNGQIIAGKGPPVSYRIQSAVHGRGTDAKKKGDAKKPKHSRGGKTWYGTESQQGAGDEPDLDRPGKVGSDLTQDVQCYMGLGGGTGEGGSRQSN